MLILAHRGHHAELPENTLDAFEAAVKLGVDGIETDLRFSADGMPVLFHDAAAKNGAAVARLTRNELAVASGYEVPSLDEVLASWPGILWNVEVKAPADPQAVLRVLAPYLRSRRLLVTSFDHDLVVAVAREIPSDCGLLVGERPQALAPVFSRGRPYANIRSIVTDYKIVDGAMVREIQEAGYRHFVYGVLTPAEHEACRKLGLAGVITDFPQYLLKS
ncbi:MAG: glycerophosphodiester phosphodiesterase [Betaproteobacteria bacterium]|nr:glycerophosphodiester phosphodiesterase [Betaproteobacteria bacterium]